MVVDLDAEDPGLFVDVANSVDFSSGLIFIPFLVSIQSPIRNAGIVIFFTFFGVVSFSFILSFVVIGGVDVTEIVEVVVDICDDFLSF